MYAQLDTYSNPGYPGRENRPRAEYTIFGMFFAICGYLEMSPTWIFINIPHDDGSCKIDLQQTITTKKGLLYHRLCSLTLAIIFLNCGVMYCLLTAWSATNSGPTLSGSPRYTQEKDKRPAESRVPCLYLVVVREWCNSRSLNRDLLTNRRQSTKENWMKHRPMRGCALCMQSSL